MTSPHQTHLRRMYAAIWAGATGDELAAYFHPDSAQIGYPSLMRPYGHRRGLAEMRQAAEVGAQVFTQHYAVHTMVDDRDRLAVQFTWTATVAANVGIVPPPAPARCPMSPRSTSCATGWCASRARTTVTNQSPARSLTWV